ncbi:MAG: hypothetical protein ACI965_000145 [Paraglaciecola sp.]|jgi:uncharacterized protein (DUF342 family)
MEGVSLTVDEKDRYLDLKIEPALIEKQLSARSIHEIINNSEFKHFFIFDESILEALSNYKNAAKNGSKGIVCERIGERRQSDVKCRILEGELSAIIVITCGHAGKTLSLDDLKNTANQAGIVRGLGQKRLSGLLEKIKYAAPGEIFEDVIARGLPPRNGRSSKLKPLVQNVLERILRPQKSSATTVDMRNLGDIVSVKIGTELLRRMPPTKGRIGFSVTGAELEAKAGEWIPFKPGDGTVISPDDENLLLADITGMPKFQDQKMWVDDTFICKGVNVGSGNVKYDGAVLVNGDVTEKMCIEASGDVTINGFVESASVKAGGDIIITGGALGKVNDSNTVYSATLNAQGSIHIQHGQGLDISCDGNVTIGRQLAYSRIVCGGEVTVGAVDNPNGNLFACNIKSNKKISAGTLGAVSGSHLSIDFSDGLNSLLERTETLDELLRQVRQNYLRHKGHMSIIASKFVPEHMKERVTKAKALYENESRLLEWIQGKLLELKSSKEQYEQDMILVANKRIYPGVVVKLNNRTWRADREYDRAKIFFHDHQWHYEPL